MHWQWIYLAYHNRRNIQKTNQSILLYLSLLNLCIRSSNWLTACLTCYWGSFSNSHDAWVISEGSWESWNCNSSINFLGLVRMIKCPAWKAWSKSANLTLMYHMNHRPFPLMNICLQSVLVSSFPPSHIRGAQTEVGCRKAWRLTLSALQARQRRNGADSTVKSRGKRRGSPIMYTSTN